MQPDHDVVCPTLIGRESEIAATSRVLERARQGNGNVALLVGEAGVGKSRLLRAMIEAARGDGFFVLRAATFEGETSIPYAPLVDLIRQLSATASAALVAHLLSPAAAELAGMFPELRPLLPDATPTPGIDPETDKRRLFHAFTQVVTTLARTQPVFIAVEDVHWSDDATLDLIFHLARAHASHPVAIALTYRGEETGPRLERLVADLERARLSTMVPLEPLRRGDVAEMLHAIFGDGDTLGEEFTHLLHGLTEGNPFFVEETLKALIIAGDLTAVKGQGWRARPLERVRVPRTAVEAVRRRLAALTGPAREVASTAAVAGRRFDFELLQAVTGHDERQLLSLVKELIAAQLVVEESTERFAFRHALTREAIYAELLGRERVALHRDVAAAIERAHVDSLDAVAEALEYHTWQAGDWDHAAVHAARAARHALALSAPREAVAHLDRAFSASERAGIPIATELYLSRGSANETLGRFAIADEDFTTALARARESGDGRAEWSALHALGLLWAARDYTRAGEYRRAALDVARSIGDGPLLARSLNRVGNWHVNLDDPRAGLPYHEEALTIFEAASHGSGVAETLDLIAMTYHIAGVQRRASEHYARSVDLFTATDDKRGLANALGLLALCGASYHSSSTTPFTTPAVRRELEAVQSVKLAREIGWRAGEAFLRFLIADCLAWAGEYDRAIPMARQALGQAEELDHFEWTAGSLRLLGTLSVDLLALATGREHLESSHRIALRLGSRVWIRWTAAPLAIARCRTGDTAGAAALLDELLPERAGTDGQAAASPHDPAPTLADRQLWLSRAELELATGRPAEALRIVDARLAVERAENPGDTLGVPRLALLRANALTALERYEDAHAALDRARVEATKQEARPLLWRIEAAAGGLYRRQRHRVEARRAFDAAREIADDLAARVPDDSLRGEFVAGLDALIPSAPALSPERTAKAAFGGLTRRERDVAELVAYGKANKVIAHDLGIGERTVEGYVASALAKLGFGSRTQLAAWAVEKGVRPTSSPSR